VHIEVIDEHHEAYLCIEQSVRRGGLRPPVELFHVDSHPDLNAPSTAMSCYDRNSRRYVERHLGIDSYIAPLILRGIIDRVVFVGKHDLPLKRRLIGSVEGEGKILKFDIQRNFLPFFPDCRPWAYKETTDVRGLSRLRGAGACVLDIDCDYFSCNSHAEPLFRPRLNSRQEWELHRKLTSGDPYRIHLQTLVGGRKSMAIPPPFNASARWADLAIDYFTFLLPIKPVLTIVCRSVKSGYTPSYLGDRIVARLQRRLAQPPRTIGLPLRTRLAIAPHMIRHGETWYNSFTGEFFDRFSLTQKAILRSIDRGKTLGEILDQLRRRFGIDGKRAAFDLLWFILNLKRRFFLK